MQILYGQKRTRSHRSYRPQRALPRLTVKEAWDESYTVYASTVFPGEIFNETTVGQVLKAKRDRTKWLHYEEKYVDLMGAHQMAHNRPARGVIQ